MPKSVATLQTLHKHYPTLQRERVLDSIPNIMINRNLFFTYYTPYATLATLQRFSTKYGHNLSRTRISNTFGVTTNTLGVLNITFGVLINTFGVTTITLGISYTPYCNVTKKCKRNFRYACTFI